MRPEGGRGFEEQEPTRRQPDSCRMSDLMEALLASEASFRAECC